MKRFALALALVVGMIVPARADSLPSIPGPVAANGTLTLPGLGTYSTCSIDVQGTWSGALNVTGPNAAAILVRSYASDSATNTSITGNGLSFVACAGLSSLTVTGGGSNTGTANVTIAASQGIAKLGLNGVAGVAASAPITSSGGTNPTIGCASCVILNPASAQLGPINVTGGVTTGSSTYGPTSATVAGTITAGTGSGGLDAIRIPDSCVGGTVNLFTNTSIYKVAGVTPNMLGWYCGGASFAMDTAGDFGAYGSFKTGSSTYGPTSATVNGPITQPGYAQHGILSITTPASCTAFSACAGGSVTFTTAMTSAAYECTATAETYPYTVIVSSKTTSAATFELYPLVAVSSAQTVPVDYSCAV